MAHLVGVGGANMTNSLSFNQSLDANETASCAVTDTSAHPFFMLVCGLVFLVGLALNGFTLKVYFCQRHEASSSSSSSSVMVYLKNLAIADFLLCLCLPLRISNYAYGHNNVAVRIIYCTVGASTFYLNMYISILFMGYIAANRYLKIVQPSASNPLQKVRVACVISAVTWCSLLAPVVAYNVAMFLLTSQPRRTHLAGAVSCDALHGPQMSLLYKVLHSFSAVIFVSVLISLVYFYRGTVKRLTLAQRSQPGGGGGAEGAVVGGGGAPSSTGTSRRCKKLSRCRRNMLVLVAVFCVCFVPYHLVRLPYAFLSRRCSLGLSFFYLKEFSLMLSILNICLDPLIYFIFCKAFRARLSLGKKKSRRRRASQDLLDTSRVLTGERTSVIMTKVERRSDHEEC